MAGKRTASGATTSKHKEIWAGLALFCSVYYIITLNAEILGGKSVGLPAEAIIFGTVLSVIFFNATGVLMT